MSDSDDLKTRLLRSEAVTSLASERTIATQLRELDWSVAHGSFFVDPVTHKLRETDVLARRFWQRRSASRDQTALLRLVIEAKTLRGYHLVFAPSSSPSDYAVIEREWIGYASERSATQALPIEALKRADVEISRIYSVVDRLFDKAYPEESLVVGDLMIKAPPAPFAASAFRETNIGGQKDLNASVLWKAAQTLSAFLKHATTEYLNSSFEFLEFVSDYARSRDLDVVDTLLDELDDMVQRVELFHPVIVVDAKLWALKDTDIEKLTWCRFHRLDSNGLMSAWYDVVQSESLDSYLQIVTTHYDKSMKEVGAKR